MKYRMIVAGGRHFNNYHLLKHKLNLYTKNIHHSDLTVVSGKVRGADTLGEKWAEEHGVSVAEFPADWNKHGKAAGYIRNKNMADYAVEEGKGLLVAFWDGESRGTKSMIELAKKIGLDVRVVMYE